MRSHGTITLFFVKVIAFVARKILSLRYKVEIIGTSVFNNNKPSLLLPSHQALVDPIILMSHVYNHTTAIPVITSDFYDIPILKTAFRNWGAIRVSNLEGGSRNTNVLDEISQSVLNGLSLNKNIILYPSGQIAGQGFEKIFNKKSAHAIVSNAPENTQVVGVRITGLWGSMWSKAWNGKTPNFTMLLFRSLFYFIVNLIFFLPRRKVTIEFENITNSTKNAAKESRLAFNSTLEVFYNRYGEEDTFFLKHYFFGKKPRRKLPEKISGSVNEEMHEVVQVDIEHLPHNILGKVQTIIAATIQIDASEIHPHNNLKVDLGVDSLNMVEIVSELENNFTTFVAPQINDVKTVGDLCLVAMGQFSSDSDLKPSQLSKSLTKTGLITVNANTSILNQFITTFTSNGGDYFAYDAMLGSTNRKAFLLKACVVAEIIKSKVKGKHVGIMLPALQSTTLLIAATYIAEKVPVMLNWTVGKKVLEHCINISEVEVILSAGTFISKIEEQLPASIKDKLVLLEKEVPKVNLGKKLKGLLVSKMPKMLVPKSQLDDTAVVLFTSGSEAMPKAVPLSHKNIVSDLNGVFSMIELSNNLVFLGFLPPFHSFGFTVLSILPLITGVKVAYTPDPTDAREVLKILKHTKANILLGTPGFLKMMMNHGSEYLFKTVKYVISGAEAMPPSLKQQFDDLTQDALLLEGYGITECSPVLTLNPIKEQKANSVGKFLPNIDNIILDLDSGIRAKTMESGMIYVKGANVFNGYLGANSINPFEEVEGKQYYKTGDLGYIDSDGYLFITGRLKRFIKIAGEMISLPFIEKILLQQYGEEEEQVLAVEGSDKVTPPQIVLFTSRNIDLDEANTYLLENGVAPISKLKKVIRLDEIPVLGTGKTDYKVLRRMVEG